MDKIKFSHRYSKLSGKVFTTIRRYDRYTADKQYEVDVKFGFGKTHRFDAFLLDKYKRRLRDIPTGLLLYDTDEPTRERAVELLNSFYRKRVEDDEVLTILLFMRLEDE